MNPILPRTRRAAAAPSLSRVPRTRTGFAPQGLLALALLSGSILLAQNPRDPFTKWVSIFNGKDLAGWVKVGKEKWEVKDGIIYGSGITDQYGYLRTEKRYSDFHLAVKFKCLGDGNSGVYFRSDFEPGSVKLSQGLQVEIDRRMGYHTGGIHGVGRSWVAWPALENEAVLRPYDWNELIVKIESNRYWVRLNGVVVMDFTDPKPLSLEGHISLQLHSGGLGNMMFKDIFIRDLSKK
jgi:hypothetical protein